MAALLFAALAGASFGALAVAVRWGLRGGADAEVAALVATTLGVAMSAVVAAPSLAGEGVDRAELWPFFAAGLIAPGASQILLTLSVRHAGPTRAAMLMGTAPLMSIMIALTVLDESFRLLLVLGTVLIVFGGLVLARERTHPAHFRVRGLMLALICAALFAARDNILRWGASNEHPPPLVAATASLLGAALFTLVYLVVARRDRLRAQLLRSLPAFAPAGVALAAGYGALLAALDNGPVSVVSPLNATGSLWAVLLAALVIGRSEQIGRRTVLAATLIFAGGVLIGACC